MLKTEQAIELAMQIFAKQTACLPAVEIIEVPKSKHGDEEDMVVLISDLQIGHKTSSTDIAIIKKRMQNLTRRVVKIVGLHRHMYPIKTLWVFALGDFLQNELIGRFVSLDELESVVGFQYIEASNLLAEFLMNVARHFEKVKVRCVRGNHGVAQKYAANLTNWDDVVYERARLLVSGQKNIDFIRSEKFYWIENIRGHKFMLVHGDQIPAYLNIPLYGITQRAMRWQGSIEPFDYLVLGHFHTSAFLSWNKVEIIMNGCFVTDDEYVIKRWGFASEPVQVCFGIHKRKGVTFRYRLHLD